MKNTKMSIRDNHDDFLGINLFYKNSSTRTPPENLFGMSSYSHHDDEHFILNISIFHYV